MKDFVVLADSTCDLNKEMREKYIKRANYEMHFITKMGFEGYYLLVYSYVSSVKRRGIARGSGGGSLIAYLCVFIRVALSLRRPVFL